MTPIANTSPNASATTAVQDPAFFSSLAPIADDPASPPLVRHMIRASRSCGVGPMAAVAGAIAAYVGRDLLPLSREVIIENGGDLFIQSDKPRTIGIFAGASPSPIVSLW